MSPAPAIDRKALVEDNLDLVRICASVMMRKHSRADRDELVSAGNVGLVSAARRFDGRHDFRTYAKQRIFGEIYDYLRLIDPLSRRARQKAKADGETGSFTVAIEDVPFHDLSQSADVEMEAKIDVRSLLSLISQRYAEIVWWRYIDGLEQPEIAAHLGVTQARVSQILIKAVRQMRKQVIRYESRT